ncbi:MAG TPA: hypothetical protein DEG93_08715, partial [Gammaproteobacteria bacterium]|nr:hypothetical protein [Gammaproteobacteria bacterium]
RFKNSGFLLRIGQALAWLVIPWYMIQFDEPQPVYLQKYLSAGQRQLTAMKTRTRQHAQDSNI